MNESTKAAIARVEAGSGKNKKRGTAFLVSEKYLLTAVHVVGNRATLLKGERKTFFKSIKLFFLDSDVPVSAKVVEDCWNALDDWALLKVIQKDEDKIPVDAKPISLAYLPDLPNGFLPEYVSWGYPESHGFCGFALNGWVNDANAKLQDKAAAMQLHCTQLVNGDTLYGVSGAPCMIGQYAVGIAKIHDVEKGYVGIIPISRVKYAAMFACPCRMPYGYATSIYQARFLPSGN